MTKKEARRHNTRLRRTQTPTRSNKTSDSSTDTIKAAEEVALSAFASGLRLAAAFGTVAAKTTSLALASLASGADTFSELVKKEALASSSQKTSGRTHRRARKTEST
jgi:hypothetical protein